MATNMEYTILVVGATGLQGSAVLAELSKLVSPGNGPSSSSSSLPSGLVPVGVAVKVLALTRDESSAKALRLASSYPDLDLRVVEGDTRAPEAIFAAHPSIDAVFTYTAPPDELLQAKALIDAAAHGPRKEKPRHLVFSSAERGGDARSWENPVDEVPRFREKHEIELYLREQCGKGGDLTYTILRPVAFFDNLRPGSSFSSLMTALWSTMPPDAKLQHISVRDIGLFAAKALLSPLTSSSSSSSPNQSSRVPPSDDFERRFRNRAIGLAGDELTYREARAKFREVTGSELPQAWWIVGKGARWGIKEVGGMFDWLEREGYGVDIEALRREEPQLQNFETWLLESSDFACRETR
jgi:uncharacterized protein YbjT (DUF2867 family)